MALTHQSVSLFTLNNGAAVDMLGKFRAFGFDPEIVTADGRTVTERYGNEVPTKRRAGFSIEELVTAGGRRQTNLNITAFSVAGDDILFRLRGGSLSVNTVTDEVSGAADEWESEVACGTDFSIDSNYRVDLNPAFVQNVIDSDIADLDVQVVVSAGGLSATLPMVLKNANLRIDAAKAQMEGATLVNRGGAPTGVSGNPLLVSILTGTAALGYNIRTSPGVGGAAIAGNCLIKSTRISFDNAAIIAASHTFTNVGTPTVTRAS